MLQRNQYRRSFREHGTRRSIFLFRVPLQRLHTAQEIDPAEIIFFISGNRVYNFDGIG